MVTPHPLGQVLTETMGYDYSGCYEVRTGYLKKAENTIYAHRPIFLCNDATNRYHYPQPERRSGHDQLCPEFPGVSEK